MFNKIISQKELNYINLLPRPIVFVPMAVDLLHHGHIRLLDKASKYGTVIVGLMTDRGLESYKRTPFLNYQERKEIISSIKTVDHVIPLNGLVYLEVADILKCNYFVHGTDWKKGPQSLTRKKLIIAVKEWGGKVIEIPYTKNISSTKIRNFFFKNIK
tara:strand:+ start:562 stop:1035 length:474 start_codon:yes stop_codon:yes gene_type:complete